MIPTTTKIKKIGGSIMLIIPPHTAKHLKLREGNTVIIDHCENLIEAPTGKYIKITKITHDTN